MKPSRDETAAVMKRITAITHMTDYAIAIRLRKISGHPVSPTSITNYRKGTPVVDYLVYPLASLTGFVIEPYEIRPDVFPAPGQDLPRPASAQPAA